MGTVVLFSEIENQKQNHQQDHDQISLQGLLQIITMTGSFPKEPHYHELNVHHPYDP
jgi:hypothetical protein